ncbi:hypothetical protein NA57DRAFT_77123 [Rhizodiscina lignyota]|uniref:DUF7730 domain-containing protein n=1 Tax=Rhizodiscina lignyota TaxID=1504668 RepID=A0A9P4MA16_9PEZI|nr:hypothetical protein NA57DRAFT_77123 [Rhizodiscina lignyota]
MEDDMTPDFPPASSDNFPRLRYARVRSELPLWPSESSRPAAQDLMAAGSSIDSYQASQQHSEDLGTLSAQQSNTSSSVGVEMLDSRRISFLDLSGELRNQIYAEYFKLRVHSCDWDWDNDENLCEYYIMRGVTLDACAMPQPERRLVAEHSETLRYSAWPPNNGRYTALLRTCRQVYEEALPFLYDRCAFEIIGNGGQLDMFHDLLSPRARTLVQRLGVSYHLSSDFNKAFLRAVETDAYWSTLTTVTTSHTNLQSLAVAREALIQFVTSLLEYSFFVIVRMEGL